MISTDISEDGIGGMRLDPNDHQVRQQLVADRERDDVVVKMAEVRPPSLRQQAKRRELVPRWLEEQLRVNRLGAEPFGRRRLKHRRVRRAQFAQPRRRVLDRGRNLGTPLAVEVFDPEQIGAGLAELCLNGSQGAQIDVARVQLDLGDQVIEH